MKSLQVPIIIGFGLSLIVLISTVSIMPAVLAETWFPGEGLKQGEFFRYKICTEFRGCSTTPEFDFWVQNQTRDGNWNLQFVVIDKNNTQKGTITIDLVSSDPQKYTQNLPKYASIFKNTIVWINHFSNKTQPKDFNNTQWGNWGLHNLGGGIFELETLQPQGEKQVTVEAGNFTAWVLDLGHKGAGEFWIVPSLPFPIKGTVSNTILGIVGPRLLFDFELLEVGNKIVPPKFVILEKTISSANPSTGNKTTNVYNESPLKQFKVGISIGNIKCNNGLQLIGKRTDGSPACVRQTTFARLLSSKWGFDPSKQWTFDGLGDTYKSGDPIIFGVKYQGFGSLCLWANLEVKQDNKTVWTGIHAAMSCPPHPDLSYHEKEWRTGPNALLGNLVLNKTGIYSVQVNGDYAQKNITIMP